MDESINGDAVLVEAGSFVCADKMSRGKIRAMCCFTMQ